MKAIIFLLVSIMFFSCGNQKENSDKKTAPNLTSNLKGTSYTEKFNNGKLKMLRTSNEYKTWYENGILEQIE